VVVSLPYVLPDCVWKNATIMYEKWPKLQSSYS